MESMESSGMSILEMPSAKAFHSSLGTHSDVIVIRCRKQNQKSSLANSLMMSLGLPRLTIPKRLAASTYSNTNLPSHLWTIACMQRKTPKSSLYVEDWMASHSEKYSLAISRGPDIV